MCAQATVIASSPAAEPVRLPEPQTRGYIIHLVRNLSRNWLELEIKRIAEAGFNLILFPAYNNGWTLYPSEAARSYGMARMNPLFRSWDPLGVVTELARAAGLTVWAYARAYNFHPRYSVAEHKLLKKYPQWRQRVHPDFQGPQTRRHEMWHPCPINIEYRRYLADILVEMVAGYPVDGIMFNFQDLGIEGGPLADSPYCFCQSCREDYYATYHADLISDASGKKLERVRHWQKGQLQENFSYLRHRLIRSRRTLRIICRARPDWRGELGGEPPATSGSSLMDWPGLLASGAIEELAIDHDAEPCGPLLGARLAADYAHLGDRVLFAPILSIGDLHELRWPLEAIGRYPIPGFFAEFQSSFTEEEARFMRETYFPDMAPLPEAEPIRTAAFLLSRIRLLHEDQPVIHDLLFDVLRLLTRQMPIPNDFATLQVIEQNLHGLEQFIRRGRLRTTRIPERTMRDLGLARRFVRMACMDVRS